MSKVWRGEVLVVADLRIADNPFTRMAGLGFIRDFPEGQGLLLVPCNSVHTMWPALPIDVVFLSAAQRSPLRDSDAAQPATALILEAVQLRYMRFSPVVWSARSVLELPAGTIARHGLEAGQTLTIEK
jgi:uncharacterized membrane protein (UPF0127 family)